MSQILDTLKTLHETREDELENWFIKTRTNAAPFFYTSVDLRHSGLRITPVDTNIFPAGFNILSKAARERASNCIQHFLEENYPLAKRVLIIPENHTRNLAYFDNLATLLSLFEKIGIEAKIASLTTTDNNPKKFISASNIQITQYPLIKTDAKLSLEDGFTPDLILMNNDLTTGIPDILKNIEQPIIPPTRMGWFQRHKSLHFSEYKKLAEDFCSEFNIDPWLICAESHQCGMVDFRDKESLECLAESINEILSLAKKKHIEYGIEQDPYIYIKADSGTYGMGIMTVKSANEVLELNKKMRNKMQVVKEGARVSEVIIQEGIKTIDLVENSPAEPMIYMIDGIPIGGIYRVNGKRDMLGNLNATGMHFTGMCDETEDENGNEKWKKIQNCSFHSHGIIASIAALAAAREKY